MTRNGVSDDRLDLSLEVARILEDLKQTPSGVVIYDQLIRIIDDWRSASSNINHGETSLRIDWAYFSLISFLLIAYARDFSSDNITRINAWLIRARTMPAHRESDSHALLDLLDMITDQDDNVAPERENIKLILSKLMRNLGELTQPLTAVDQDGAPSELVRVTKPDQNINNQGKYTGQERRVNSAYRLHLDKKHVEIEKLQETLALKTKEAINQNKEFGDLLEIELSALKQADNYNEIEDLKEILINGTQELIQGQKILGEKLYSSSDYLKLVKNDSERLRNELDKVRLLSLTDEFTGLPNRRAFMRRLEDEIGRAQRYGTPLALALLDLDKFKSINDRFGHSAGDSVLRWYADHALSIFRHHDMVARYGGEEFAVLLPNTNDKGAHCAFKKVIRRVNNSEYEANDMKMPLPTFSAGMTLYTPGESPTDLINRADTALYRAKNLGRNRIEVELLKSIKDLKPGNNNGNHQ